MRWNSLRVQVGGWYALFTLACMLAFGMVLSFYLSRALEASRAPTMVRRSARLVAFVNWQHQTMPGRSLDESLRAFLKASPETDEVVVRSADLQTVFFSDGGEPTLQEQPRCVATCFYEFMLDGHHFRSYTHPVLLAGVRCPSHSLEMSMSITEFYARCSARCFYSFRS